MAQFINSVTIRLVYKNGEMVIPVNPESIKVSRTNDNKTENVIGLGEIIIPRGPGLATIDINSAFYRYWIEMFPEKHVYRTTKEYADWFKGWQRSKLPARWTVEELGYNLQVVCESFSYDVNAGEEDDVYYELSLKEYRPYGAKVVNIKADNTAPPVAETRVDNTPPVQQTYTVRSGDSLWAISKRLSGSGDNWNALYGENKTVVGNNPDRIYPGQVLVVPATWVTS